MTAKKRHSSGHHVNVHTECGRHGDDWLFNGFSVKENMEKMKKMWVPHRDWEENGEASGEGYGYENDKGKGGGGEKRKKGKK
jgi:hypothetical protein